MSLPSHQKLRFTSLQAPNQDFIIRELANYVGKTLGVQTELIIDLPWQDREVLLDRGQMDVAWICGLPYATKVDRGEPRIALLAAPVMRGDRYADRPIYFSDVIVRVDTPYQTFEDLRGTTWAYNEPGSQSGYNLTRYHLSRMGAPNGFFHQVVEAGSHERSIVLVLEGGVDAAAIDSTVLEIARAQDPRIDRELRILITLGPSPIPPLVVSEGVKKELRHSLQTAILEMHQSHGVQEILAAGGIRRFTIVKDEDYDPIRHMAKIAQDVRF